MFYTYNILFFGLDISYLYLGDVFAIFSLLIIAMLDDYKKKIALFMSSTYFLYLLGSRSSLYFFLVVFIVYLFKFFFVRRKLFARIGLITVVLFGILIFVLSVDLNLVTDNRMLRIISSSNRVTDYSQIARNSILVAGIDNIKENWFWGDYLAEFRVRGGWGAYIHNILSYWEEYGIVVFIMFIYQCLFTLVYNVRRFFSISGKVVEFSTYIAIFCVLSVIFTRSYIYHYAWLAFGLTTCLMKIIKKEEVVNYES